MQYTMNQISNCLAANIQSRGFVRREEQHRGRPHIHVIIIRTSNQQTKRNGSTSVAFQSEIVKIQEDGERRCVSSQIEVQSKKGFGFITFYMNTFRLSISL